MMLPDGSVVPSSLSSQSIGEHLDMGSSSNLSMRIGEVKEIIYPSSSRSVSKKYLEYRVAVQQNDGMETGATVEYANCQMMNMFGGVADRLVFTLRPDTQVTSENGVGVGSKVVIMCLDGNSQRAVIVGGLRDDVGGETQALGHRFVFEFNGLHAAINKDGEMQMMFKGATGADGKLLDGVDEKNSGTILQFLKNGDFQIGHDNEVLTLDHGGTRWTLTADKDLKTTLGGDWTTVADGSGSFQTKGDMDLLTNQTMTLTAKTVKVGSSKASEHLVLGDAYRSGESQMTQGLIMSLTTLATSLQTLTGAMTTAAISLAIPVVGGIVAAPSFAIVNSQLEIIGQEISKMMSDIETFESSAGTYLSNNHVTEQ